MSSAKHLGLPESCRACSPLPVSWNARQDAIWLHALAQFVDQSGIDPDSMSHSDLVPLVRSWARANSVARMDRELLTEDRAKAELRYETRSFRFALSLMFAVLACLLLICAGVWRFVS